MAPFNREKNFISVQKMLNSCFFREKQRIFVYRYVYHYIEQVKLENVK